MREPLVQMRRERENSSPLFVTHGFRARCVALKLNDTMVRAQLVEQAVAHFPASICCGVAAELSIRAT